MFTTGAKKQSICLFANIAKTDSKVLIKVTDSRLITEINHWCVGSPEFNITGLYLHLNFDQNFLKHSLKMAITFDLVPIW